MEGLAGLLPLVAIVAIFWLLVIRPAQRRQREAVRMQEAVSVGDDVILTSGIFATVVGLDDDRVRVSIAPGVEVQVARGAIGGLVPVRTEPNDYDTYDAPGGADDTGGPESTTDQQEG